MIQGNFLIGRRTERFYWLRAPAYEHQFENPPEKLAFQLLLQYDMSILAFLKIIFWLLAKMKSKYFEPFHLANIN